MLWPAPSGGEPAGGMTIDQLRRWVIQTTGRNLDPEPWPGGPEQEGACFLAVDVEVLDDSRAADVRILVGTDHDRADCDRDVSGLVRAAPSLP